MPPDPRQRASDSVINDTPVDVGMAVNLTDSEEEELEYTQEYYQVLSQEMGEDILTDSESESDTETEDEESEPDLTDKQVSNSSPTPGTSDDVSDLWNICSTSRNDDIVMDPEKQAAVMSAMACFSLPLSAYPGWARDVPEDEWKNELLNKIDKLKQK